MTREYVTSPADITKLAASIMGARDNETQGRATYLRSLLAATQEELSGKPVLRVTGRTKALDAEAASAAFEKVSETFYAAVLKALPEEIESEEQQTRTAFARSAASTLRRAIKTGWNPLSMSVTTVTKGQLAEWTAKHSSPRAPSVAATERRAMAYTERVTELLDALPKDEAERVLSLVLAALGQPLPQRLTNVSLRRQDPARPAVQ